jgi:hypothetical protein
VLTLVAPVGLGSPRAYKLVRTSRTENSVIALSFSCLQQAGLEVAAEAEGFGVFAHGADAERDVFFDRNA